ncbi:glucosamine-6-phosphate deaminase, partial [Enterococcus faecium]|nr:glucosamine-6-phosphate deaminase [Enterococcus faecium]MCZ1397393.1 glucosamine-6-phosphate deaminase [Enterococcus faecium]
NETIKVMIKGPVTNELATSVLQNHYKGVVISEEAAASKL